MRKIIMLIALMMWIVLLSEPIAVATPLNSTSGFTIFHPNQEKTFAVGDDVFTLRHFTNASNQDTSQALSVTEIVHAPNAKTGGFLLEQHLVEVPETLYVSVGEFEFFSSPSNKVIKTKVTAGDVVSIPAGVPYGYKNVGSEPGKILLITTSDNFEHFIEEIGTPVTGTIALDRSTQPSMDKIAAVAHKYDIDFLN